MKSITKTLAIALGTALLATPALAGQTQPAEVNVDLDTMFASGDMVTARGSKGDSEFIGCGTRNFEDGAGGLFSWAFCQAEDADGDRATCFTFNPDLVKTINAINDTSYIQFAWTDDGSGSLTCTRMGFSTQSFYLGQNQRANIGKNGN